MLLYVMANLHRSHPNIKPMNCHVDLRLLYGGGKLVDIGIRLTFS